VQNHLDTLDTSDVGEAGSEVRFIFGPEEDRRTYLPDFSYVVAHRLPAEPDKINGPFLGPPDLAVEILSPDDQPGRVLDKILFYLDKGVRMVWVVDPVERSVRVYRPDGYRRILLAGDTLAGGDLLPGFSVAVADLFPKRS
jgi:Uma2 family endonuclease